ncbi:hypothetical protein RD792_008194 [Penstemon davidsonii]|uniref:Glutamate receptor n=1 Tax=Penstemon davidsonii TaxID=160366 RepID=A0ABR0D8G0_9LAMI|nr:hypothetical protein RD792_008194 [Penstemon davidsonii]
MRRPSRFIIIHVLFSFIFLNLNCFSARTVDVQNGTSETTKSFVQIGVVLDLNSPMGSMADSYMNMSISDFYSANPNYTTRLHLHTRNAKSVFDVSSAVLDLLKNEEVDVILGPQKTTEETFVAEVGVKAHVPIISFTARSSTLSYTDNHYFVRATLDDAVQAQALASICQGFEWPEVAVLYEDTEYGSQFLSHINKAFQEVEVGIAYMTSIPTSIEDSNLLNELKRLSTQQTRVFLVHMNPSLGYRFFTLAKREGLMSEGYAWIISDSLSNFMSSIDSITRDSMEGVLGIRPYIHRSNELENFQKRWKRNTVLDMELNVYGLWAYDAITALAIAVEKIKPLNSSSSSNVGTSKNTDMRISTLGPRLLNELSRIQFKGLAGDFQLVDGKLKPSAFEIFNIFGSGEKTIGYWTPNKGIITDLNSAGEKELKNIIWPGDSITRPKGWAIPTTGNLRVGIPWKHGFTEFVETKIDPRNASGFAIDIFLATLNVLPFHINYEFLPYNDTKNIDWSYDDMLQKIPQDFDMVVGDTTIWAPRAEYVDFSLPYSESGVILVVKNKKPIDMWIFVKPLRWDLWLAIVVACILMGIVLRVLERSVTRNEEDPIRANKEKPGMIYLSPVTILAFPERTVVSNNWSFLVLVFWFFMAFILMQSYTANLSAILTVDQLKFAFSDNYHVGFQEGSFMKEFLTKQLHISESMLRSYSSAEEYHEAMSKGSKNGGIDAIFDEVPYMKLFMKKYDSQYKMVGPSYKAGGFGFAFPLGSPLAAHFSKAILEVTQSPDMTSIEQQNFGPGYSSQDPLSSTISQGASSLTSYDFAGLFLIIGSVTIFSLFCSQTPIGRKLTKMVKQFIQICVNFKTSEVHPADASVGNASLREEGFYGIAIGEASENSEDEIQEIRNS